MESMKTLKARVEKGRLVMNEPTDLPEGTELELIPADDFDDSSLDDLDPEIRADLMDSITESLKQAERGDTRPASEILDRLRKL